MIKLKCLLHLCGPFFPFFVGLRIAHPHHWGSAAGHGDGAVLRRVWTHQRSGCHALLLSAEHLLQEGKSHSGGCQWVELKSTWWLSCESPGPEPPGL